MPCVTAVIMKGQRYNQRKLCRWCRQGWGQQQAQHRSGHASPWLPEVEMHAPMSVVYEFIVLQEIL